MKNFLPDQFQFSHDFCIKLHDELAHFIVYGEKERLFHTHFEFRSTEEVNELSSNPEIDIWDWLEKRERGDVLGEILLKSIFPGLLSDFCHFVYEALSCSRKAKLTVAYSLLRKPLKENLHYLEWLIADPDGLLNTFYNNDSVELSFSRIGDPERVKKIIKNAQEKIFHQYMFNAEFLFDLRYNKNAPFGFEPLWNKAIHLITTKPPLGTEKQNFNFVFSDDQARLTQWEQIYRTLPYLLFYTVEICEVLMAVIIKKPMPDFSAASFHRSLGFMLWSEEIYRKLDGGTEELPPGLRKFNLECPYCGKTIPPDIERIRIMYAGKKIRCPICGKKIGFQDFLKEPNSLLSASIQKNDVSNLS